MPYDKPLPSPTPETKEFWDGLKQHELRVMYCAACDSSYLYPRRNCPTCLAPGEWRQASGKGKLHTYMIAHQPARNFEAPYVIAVIELDEGPRLMSNIVGVEPDPAKLPVDMPVAIVFDDVTEEITLPKFRPA